MTAYLVSIPTPNDHRARHAAGVPYPGATIISSTTVRPIEVSASFSLNLRYQAARVPHGILHPSYSPFLLPLSRIRLPSQIHRRWHSKPYRKRCACSGFWTKPKAVGGCETSNGSKRRSNGDSRHGQCSGNLHRNLPLR